jgi:hypothetical protein
MVLAIDEPVAESSASDKKSPQPLAAGPPSVPAIPFADIHSPGAYILREFGILVRVPPEALLAGRSPRIDMVSNRPLVVTMLSTNPWLPISRARSIAADLDLVAHF